MSEFRGDQGPVRESLNQAQVNRAVETPTFPRAPEIPRPEIKHPPVLGGWRKWVAIGIATAATIGGGAWWLGNRGGGFIEPNPSSTPIGTATPRPSESGASPTPPPTVEPDPTGTPEATPPPSDKPVETPPPDPILKNVELWNGDRWESSGESEKFGIVKGAHSENPDLTLYQGIFLGVDKERGEVYILMEDFTGDPHYVTFEINRDLFFQTDVIYEKIAGTNSPNPRFWDTGAEALEELSNPSYLGKIVNFKQPKGTTGVPQQSPFFQAIRDQAPQAVELRNFETLAAEEDVTEEDYPDFVSKTNVNKKPLLVDLIFYEPAQ